MNGIGWLFGMGGLGNLVFRIGNRLGHGIACFVFNCPVC